MKNIFAIGLISFVYAMLAIATSKTMPLTEYEKCVYKMEDTLLSNNYGLTTFVEHYRVDTIFYRITDTSKINTAANYICQTLKDSCSKQNTVLQFFDTTYTIQDPIRQIRGRLVKTIKCN